MQCSSFSVHPFRLLGSLLVGFWIGFSVISFRISCYTLAIYASGIPDAREYPRIQHLHIVYICCTLYISYMAERKKQANGAQNFIMQNAVLLKYRSTEFNTTTHTLRVHACTNSNTSSKRRNPVFRFPLFYRASRGKLRKKAREYFKH